MSISKNDTLLVAGVILALIVIVLGIFLAVRQSGSNLSQTFAPSQEEMSVQPTLISDNSVVTPQLTPEPITPPRPSQKQLAGGTQVFQTFNNCGPAALSMALSHYGISVSQQVLGQALRPYQHPTGDNDDKSVTLAELATVAEEYNLIPYHRPAGTQEIIKQLLALDLPVVARTWLKPAEDIGHYRVITGYNDVTGQFTQDDSLQGADLHYAYAVFDELWGPFSYEFLVLVPPAKQAQVEAVLGELLDERVAWQRALQLADETLQTQPDDRYSMFNRSVALYHLGRHAEAIQAYEMVALRLPSRMLWYQIEPILAYYKNGDYDTVIQMADQILGRNNRAYSELYQLKGLIYQSTGEENLAQEMFRLAAVYNSTTAWKVNLE